MSNNGAGSACIAYNGVVSNRCFVFADGNQYFSMNSSLGLSTGYSSSSNVQCEMRCNLTGVLITLNNNYIQIGASGVSLQGDIYLCKTLSSKKNIDVLTFFRDFDKNKNGLITESQVKK